MNFYQQYGPPICPMRQNENSSNEESMPDQCRDQLPHQQEDNQIMPMSPFQSHNSFNRNSNFQSQNGTQHPFSNQYDDSKNAYRQQFPQATSPSAYRGRIQQRGDQNYGPLDQIDRYQAFDGMSMRSQTRGIYQQDQLSLSDLQIFFFNNDNSNGFQQQEDIQSGQNEPQQQQQRQQREEGSGEKIQQQQKIKKSTQKQDTQNKQRKQQIRQQRQQKKKDAAEEKKYQKQQNMSKQTIEKKIRKKQQNKEQPNKNKRNPDKHTFLIQRDSEAKKLEQTRLTTFIFEDEFRQYFRTFIYEGEQINAETLPQIFHRIKQGMDNKIKEQGLQTKVGSAGFYMSQISMLIAKLFFYQKYFPYHEFLNLISQDLIRKFNDQEISTAIRELYLILNGYGQQEKIDWKNLVTNTIKLHYQFEVSRFHQKSSCVNYRQFIDDNNAHKFQDIDHEWYELGCDVDNPKRDEFRNALKRGLLEDFQINHYMKYFLDNPQRNDVKKWEIYLDDILNLISGSLLE